MNQKFQRVFYTPCNLQLKKKKKKDKSDNFTKTFIFEKNLQKLSIHIAVKIYLKRCRLNFQKYFKSLQTNSSFWVYIPKNHSFYADCAHIEEFCTVKTSARQLKMRTYNSICYFYERSYENATCNKLLELYKAWCCKLKEKQQNDKTVQKVKQLCVNINFRKTRFKIT